MPLDSILSVAGAMLDFLSICSNETSTVTDFSVYYEKSKPRPIEVYAGMKGYDAGSKKGRPHPALDLKDLGGIEGVARWIEVRERYGTAVPLLTSIWYNGKSYNEDQTLQDVYGC